MVPKIPELSVAVIARDEEHNLPVLFDSLEPLRARGGVEAIVVDTGSRDGTAALAASLGARVHAFAWNDDFSAARNHALSLCRGRAILWLDADDALPPATAARLASALDDPGLARHASAFRVRSPGPGGSSTVCSQIRMVPNGLGLAFRNPVHESLGESVAEAGLDVFDTGLEILHLGYRDAAVIDRKHRRNLGLLEKALSVPAPAASLLLTHARLCLAAGRPAAAETSLRRALAAAPEGSDLARAARIHLAQAFMARGLAGDAARLLAPGAARDAHALQLLELGKALWLDGRHCEAREAWRAALEAGPSPTSIPTDWNAVIAGARRLLAETAPSAAGKAA